MLREIYDLKKTFSLFLGHLSYMVHCSGWDEGERVAYLTYTTFIHPSLKHSLKYQLLYPTNLYSNIYIETLLLKISLK
jgi:hypothetical protein